MISFLLLLAHAGSTAPEPTAKNFAEWTSFLAPKAKEMSWAEIPWRPSLWSAVLEARRDDKPVLLWAMNGHPLACT